MPKTVLREVKPEDISPMEITPQAAKAMLDKLPKNTLHGRSFKRQKDITEQILNGKWPTDPLIFTESGELIRGVTVLCAIVAAKKKTTLFVALPSPNTKGDARRAAQAKGLSRYYDGIPCKHGHLSERLTSCARCYQCHLNTKHQRSKNKKAAKLLRIDAFGYDPQDLRMRRKERGIVQPSMRPDLVRLREKRNGRAPRHR